MVLLVWMFAGGSSNGSRQKETYVSSNWRVKFQPFDKDPKGVFLFNRMLQVHLDTAAEIKLVNEWYELDSIRVRDSSDRTYMFIGNMFGLQSNEIDSVLVDVENGSDLFLSYHELTSNIIKRIFDEYNEELEYADSIKVFAKGMQYNMINLHQNDTIATDWKAFGEIETEEPFESLSSFMDLYNFIRIKKGEGNIFMQTNPELYYNYQVQRRDGFRYASYTIDQLSRDKDVILLEVGRLSDDFGQHDLDENTGDEEGKRDDSYLKMIFENPSLLKALLLGIAGIILFVIFRSKRIRPIVPIIEKRKNMTLAFADTITSIYFAKRNPYGLLQVQKKNFYTAIQKHFFVDLQRREGEKEIAILAEKSNKSVREINEILAGLETKEASAVNEQYVAQMAARKRKFYLETGIISEKTSERISDKEMVFKRSLLLPLFLVMASIAQLILGFVFLVKAIGIGIIFWPLGVFTMYLGIVRINSPLLRVKEDHIIYTNSFGLKRTFRREELVACDTSAKGAILRFTENRNLIINLWDMSVFDRKQFGRFVSKLHMDSYDK